MVGGAGAVGLSGTYPESDGTEQQPRIGLGTAQEALSLEVEYNSTAQSNGIYINSANTEKAGISFVDNTVNPENPTKRYYLKDFALKSDLSSVDLTNYQGEWKLTKTFNYLSGAQQTLESKVVSTGATRPYQLIRCHTTDTDLNVDTGLAVIDSENLLYTLFGTTSEQYLNGESDNYELFATQPGALAYEKVVNQERSVRTILKVGDGGISFTDTTIQSAEFTLKSLVDRIAALETQVSELQTQLAAKANTNSPTFTGKVTINSITE